MACVGLASIFAHLEVALNDVRWLALASGSLTLVDAVAVWGATRWSGMIGAALATTASSAALCLILGFRVAWLLARYANMPPTATDPGGNLLDGIVEATRGSHAAIEPATATPL
jgi:O-antigen/teichoic acid export membrane protein